ncbi:MAG: Periplasmic binding protein domain containing protein [Firmicutes bacterium]|nr:Periplasmic binding protein domain containing protein [Bacillota bacterium]
MRGRLQFAGLVLLLFVLFAAAWGYFYKESQQAANDQVEFLIGVSQANLIEPWRVVMNREIIEEAAKHKNIRIIFTDAAQSSQKQIKDVEQLLQQGVDLLIISPNDSAELTPIVAEAYKHIPVIVLDRGVQGYDYTLYIGPDNRAIGREVGKYTAELLESKGGNVVEIQGPKGLPSVRDRSEGFWDILRQYPGIKVTDIIVADWQRDKAEDEMVKLLDRQSKVDVVFAHSDYMALGAYKAAAACGRNFEIIGVDGFTGAGGGLELVQAGVLQGTFTCDTGGKEAVQYAVDILNHERGIPKKVILRSKKITRGNVFDCLKPETGKEQQKSNRKICLGFSQLGAESDWRKANSKSIKEAARAADIELLFMEANQEQEKQIQAIRYFITQKVDVIAFSPVVENGWTEVLEEAKLSGIPVIILDRAIQPDDDSLYESFIGSDFREEGRRAARWLLENSRNGQPVTIVELAGTVGSAPAIDRQQGFAEIISAYSQYKIIYSAPGDFTQAEGKEVMQEALRIYGNGIQVVYAHNDDMALGAIQAIEEFGLRPGKDILIVSVDGTKAAFAAMLAGKLNCTVECTPLLGPQLMQAISGLMAGRKLPVRIIAAEGVFPQETAHREYPYRTY